MQQFCWTWFGEQPLRESVVLERIGITLPLENMSTEAITSILDSIVIVETEGNVLREIKISNIVNAKKDKQLRNFLAKFNELLDLAFFVQMLR